MAPENMVQLFQRYVPYTAILEFLVQSLLCITAFGICVQFAWWAQLDLTLPAPPGLRAGRVLVAVAVIVLVFYLAGYFERRNQLSTSRFLPRLLQSVPLAAATLGLLYLLVPEIALGWQVTAASLGLMSLLMVGWHVAAPSFVGRDLLSERVLLIGDGAVAADISDRIDGASDWGFQLAGYVPVAGAQSTSTEVRTPVGIGTARGGADAIASAEPDAEPRPGVVPFPQPIEISAPALGQLQELELLIDRHEVHTIVVALADRRGKLPLAELVSAKLRGVAVYDAVDFYERLTGRMMVARMRPSSIIFAEGFAPGRATQLLKRTLDLLMASSLLLLTAPLQAAIALAVRATSRGPALFRQERVGLAGDAFTILKYRSMYEDAEKDGPRWAATDDDRITPVGRFLRKSRLDELPQLWNVLAGQMSFVGPRPERPVFVRQLREQIPYYDQRHTVRPGITGWAQVKYPYGASVEETLEKLEFDLYYIKRMSFAFDLTIILETFRVLLTGRGAR